MASPYGPAAAASTAGLHLRWLNDAQDSRAVRCSEQDRDSHYESARPRRRWRIWVQIDFYREEIARKLSGNPTRER
jgi:hypothetical protein